jgi:hypothetical protein
MHEKQPRLFVVHVAVQRRHLDAAGAQRRDNGVDLVGGHHEITRGRRLAATGRLEADTGRKAKRPDRG